MLLSAPFIGYVVLLKSFPQAGKKAVARLGTAFVKRLQLPCIFGLCDPIVWCGFLVLHLKCLSLVVPAFAGLLSLFLSVQLYVVIPFDLYKILRVRPH